MRLDSVPWPANDQRHTGKKPKAKLKLKDPGFRSKCKWHKGKSPKGNRPKENVQG